MTVSTTNNRISYTGNGATTVFAFPYKFIATTDIKVYVGGVLQTSGYTVGTPSDTGANITFSTAPASSASIVIISDPDLLQSSALPGTGPFPSTTVERMSDKLTLIAQRIRDLVGRSFTLPDSYAGAVSTVLPTPAANEFVAWNETATALQNVNPTTLINVVAFGTARSDLFSGNGSQTAFTLTANPGAQANLDVSISGVTQRPGIDYTWSAGTALTFTSAPPSGTNNILVRYLQGLAQGTSDSASAAFIQAGTGAVTRTAQEKLREVVSVKDFGAIGDGVADDTAAIQAAFSSGARGVYFPAGTYQTSSTLTLASAHLFGEGATIKLNTTGAACLDITGSDVLIENLTFEGSSTAGQFAASTNYCMKFSNYTNKNNIVRNCTIKNFTFTGVILKSSNSTIENCYFYNVGYEGITSLNKYNIIQNNKFVNCCNSTTPYSGSVITVTYLSADGYTMATTLGKYNTIKGNVIDTTAQVGIDTHSGVGLVIEGNTIISSSLDGIYLHRVSPAAEGLADTDGRVSECLIANNVIRSCNTGITFASFEPSDATDRLGCVDNTVIGNSLESCSAYGIALSRGSSRIKVSGNRVRGAGIGIYISFWCDNNYITENTIVMTAASANCIRLQPSAGSTYYCDYNIVENNICDIQAFNQNGIANYAGARYTAIKHNEFINRGLKYPVIDSEAGTARQAQVVHLPRAYTTTAIASVSDMRGEIIMQMQPSAGGSPGWVCTTAGDQVSTAGTWKQMANLSV